MTNYPNSPTFNSTDKNQSQLPTLTIYDLLNMNQSPISTNKLLILKKSQFQIRPPMNPRANHFQSSRFLRIHIILGFPMLDTSRINLNQPRNTKNSVQNRNPNTHSNPFHPNTKSFETKPKISCFQPPTTII